MSQTIDVFFKVINDGAQYDSESITPFMPSKVLQMAYHSMSYLDIYIDACKDWLSNLSSEEMWATFKIFFTLEYNLLWEEQILNTTQAGLQHANHAVV